MLFWSMWSDLQLAFAATLKLKEDTALVKTTCHFTFQTFTFHSYQKSEFRNVLEIAVKSSVKVTNAALRHRIKYPALAETSFNCLSLLKVLTLSNNRRAEGSSSPHNITIHGGLVGRRSLGRWKTICQLKCSLRLFPEFLSFDRRPF